MRPLDVHHIGHAVDDLPAAVDAWTRLFAAEVEHREVVPEQGVEAVSLRLGAGRVELLRPLGPDTPVGRFLERRGPGMHHLAIRVDDVAAALRDAVAGGADAIDDEPREGLFGTRVAFIHPASAGGVLVELVEERGA
jgi:methylmalonyl-CoA/ethylmalonyl-CoA epimerase